MYDGFYFATRSSIHFVSPVVYILSTCPLTPVKYVHLRANRPPLVAAIARHRVVAQPRRHGANNTRYGGCVGARWSESYNVSHTYIDTVLTGEVLPALSCKACLMCAHCFGVMCFPRTHANDSGNTDAKNVAWRLSHSVSVTPCIPTMMCVRTAVYKDSSVFVMLVHMLRHQMFVGA